MPTNEKGIMYGDYTLCSVEKIPEAKEQLLEQMIDMIRNLAKNDEFWIVNNLLNEEETVSVAYKISFPHMVSEQQVWENNCYIAENIESCEDCGFCSKT